MKFSSSLSLINLFVNTQMEGFRVFSLEDWEASGLDASTFAAKDLKKCLEGLARYLFGTVI